MRNKLSLEGDYSLTSTLRRHTPIKDQGKEAITATCSSRKRKRSTVDWSELQPELITRLIEDHMVSVDDYAMISCVCHSWHRAAAACDRTTLRKNWIRQMPYLVVADGNDVSIPVGNAAETGNGTNDLYRGKFFNLQKNKAYNFNFPEGYGLNCWGSHYGWIATIGLDYSMCLFNPLTGSCLDLASRKPIPQVLEIQHIYEVLVLKVPSSAFGYDDGSETLVVVVVYNLPSVDNDFVVISIPGDTDWRVLKLPHDEDEDRMLTFGNAIYHNDLGLLFVTLDGALLYYKPWDKVEPLLLKWYRTHDFTYLCNLVPMPTTEYGTIMPYLVECNNEVLLVVRQVVRRGDVELDLADTVGFHFFKLDFGTKEWLTLQYLQDTTLFLSPSEAVVCRDPEVGYERNSIYFTGEMSSSTKLSNDMESLGGYAGGIYNIKDKTFLPLSLGSYTQCSKRSLSWFIPSL